MLGLIVSGHGHFAGGLVSALKLLAGEPEALQTVEFEAQDSIEILEEKIKAAVKALDDTDGIVIMTDLQGGSPFNVSMKLALADKKLEVVTGTNLPMLVEAYMSRSMYDDAETLSEAVTAAGKAQVNRLEKKTVSAFDEDDEIEFE